MFYLILLQHSIIQKILDPFYNFIFFVLFFMFYFILFYVALV